MIRSIAHQGDPAPGGGVFHGKTFAVARPGDPMPGGGAFATAGDFDATYGLDDRGDVAFAANLNTDVNGDGLPDSGLYVSHLLPTWRRRRPDQRPRRGAVLCHVDRRDRRSADGHAQMP